LRGALGNPSPRSPSEARNYSQTELREWAHRIAEWGCSVDVYAYFNNDWEVFAPRNALDLRRMVAAQTAVGAA